MQDNENKAPIEKPSEKKTYTKSSYTRDKLIRAGIKLFSRYGYDATSTRMIAQEAGVNLSAISFHFSGKENLHLACQEFISQKASSYYEDAFLEIEGLLTQEYVEAETALSCLQNLIRLQIEIAFGEKYRSSLKLINWEQTYENEGVSPVSSTIFEKVEKKMALLLSKVSSMPYSKAIIASRFINGSVIAFGEHSLLVKYALRDCDDSSAFDLNNALWIRDDIFEYCTILLKNFLMLS